MEKTTRRLRKAQATIGLDLGDKRHTFCVLDTRGEVVNKGSMRNERNELAKLASAYPGALVVMEAGMHSPWTSRFLDSLGMEVVVANPRKTRTISQSERKSDERDALVLARLGRATATCLVRSYTVAKKPNMTYSRSNCATAWCGRGWHWSIQCALP